MGLGAVVRCRCWEDASIHAPPPHPEFVRIDDADDPHLTLPWKGHEGEHDAFEIWLETCCPHPRMERARVGISNWVGLRAFQSQLLELGIDQFPTLRDVLPKSNDGTVPADLSRKALSELEDFRKRDFGTKVVLTEAGTGTVLQEYVPIYEGWFMSAPGGWTGGVDPKGFFIQGPTRFRAWLGQVDASGARTHTATRLQNGLTVMRPSRKPSAVLRRWIGRLAAGGTPTEIFRSMHFHQEQLGPHSFRFTAIRSNRSAVAPIGVSRHVEDSTDAIYPTELVVERRKRNRDEFDYILHPLKIVFEASVETGNPVRWM